MIEDRDIGQRDAERPGAAADLLFIAEHGDSRQPLFGDFRRGDDRPVVFAFRQNDVLELSGGADSQFFQDVHRRWEWIELLQRKGTKDQRVKGLEGMKRSLSFQS